MNTLETIAFGFASGFACMAVVVLIRTVFVGLVEIACHYAIEAMKPKSKTSV